MTLIGNTVCGNNQNINTLTFDDSAATVVGSNCGPPLNGTSRAQNVLSALNGHTGATPWSLNVSDVATRRGHPQRLGFAPYCQRRLRHGYADADADAHPNFELDANLKLDADADRDLDAAVVRARARTTANDLRDVFMLNIDEGWAVGTNGTVLHYAGSAWNLVNIGTSDTLVDVFFLLTHQRLHPGLDTRRHGRSHLPLQWLFVEHRVHHPFHHHLYRIDGVAANDLWAVGNGDFILHWNGSTWSQVPSNAGNAPNWRAVDMVSANEGWAVGQFGDINHYLGGVWGL